jgi:hypothetical protein
MRLRAAGSCTRQVLQKSLTRPLHEEDASSSLDVYSGILVVISMLARSTGNVFTSAARNTNDSGILQLLPCMKVVGFVI